MSEAGHSQQGAHIVSRQKRRREKWAVSSGSSRRLVGRGDRRFGREAGVRQVTVRAAGRRALQRSGTGSGATEQKWSKRRPPAERYMYSVGRVWCGSGWREFSSGMGGMFVLGRWGGGERHYGAMPAQWEQGPTLYLVSCM